VNHENLPEIEREIASALIFDSDGRLLMGRKDLSKGGVYPNAWHIPGGGRDDNESLEDTVIRELREEVGLTVTPDQLERLPRVGHGETTKTLRTGERVWCKMNFNYFEIHLPISGAESGVRPGDDLVELRWLEPSELAEVEQIPGGREFFIEMGYIPGHERSIHHD
jgi:8-oxo-dGTP pyrophosphatase MutT (NUDIX family)